MLVRQYLYWDNSVSDGVAFTPVSTATYTVTGTDGNGCENSDQVEVTVNALPTVSAGQMLLYVLEIQQY